MSPKVPANPCTDPKAIVGYWSRCLRETMLRDPKLKHHQQVKIEQVIAGRLPADVVARIQASLKASGKSKKTRSDPKSRLEKVAPPAGQTSAAGEKPKHDHVPVLVAPYLVV